MPENLTTERLTQEAAAREVTALPTRRAPSPQRLQRMSEARSLFERACSGSYRALADLQEALSTSDFPYVFGDVLDRELLAGYGSIMPIWPSFARRTTVRDFRPKKYIDLLGGKGLLEKVPQLAPYPQRAPVDSEYQLTVDKFGGAYSLSWEDTINDDLEALRDLPQGLAQGAHDTEDFTATSLVASATGPNAAMFNSTALNKVTKAGGSNLLTGNPALTVDNLSAALTAMQSRRDVDNRPIPINGFVLMVPPALEVTANNIVNAVQIRNTVGTQEVLVGNWLANKVTVVVNPWLPVVDISANAATTWYLLPKPTNARPGVVVGFLRGHEVPDLRYKAEAGRALGGGELPASEGSFDVDDIAYRVRHVLGGTTLDPIGTAASNGSGS
jgi:hypothetical protein